MNFSRKGRIILAVVLIMAAAAAFFVIGDRASSADSYSGSMETLKEIQGQAMGMTASAAGLATIAAAVPGDATTPIANKLMDLAGYMVIVYVAITVEKYLLTLTGLVAFKILVPLGLLALAVTMVFLHDRKGLAERICQVAVKCMLLGVLLWALVPVSLWTTNLIQQTYETAYADSTAAAEESAREQETGDAGSSEADDADDEKSSLWGFLDEVRVKAGEAVEKAGSAADEKVAELKLALNRMIEGIAVMIVTTCVIPICVLLLFLLLLRTVTGMNFSVPGVRNLTKASGVIRKQNVESEKSA